MSGIDYKIRISVTIVAALGFDIKETRGEEFHLMSNDIKSELVC